MRPRPSIAPLLALLTPLMLSACDNTPPMGTPDAGGGEDAGPIEPTCTTYLWEPNVGSLDTWPTRELLVEDGSTPTGFHLEASGPFVETVAGFLSYGPILTDALPHLDGFGVNAEGYLRFGRAFDVTQLPAGGFEPDPSLGVGLVVLPAAGPAELWPVQVTTTDEGATLVFIPNRPLPPKARAAAFVTRALTAAARGCLEPSEGMARMLASPDPELSAAIDALTGLSAIASAADLIALQPFVTQSVEEEARAIAAHIASSTPTLEGIVCDAPEGGMRHCAGTIEVGDYRDEDGVVRVDRADPRPVSSYVLPVHAWLPEGVPGPYPVALFGHGLSSSAEQHGHFFAARAAMEGVATVAVSAVAHPGHPTNEGGATGLVATLNFFAANPAAQTLEILRLRDHFQQSAFDKLAVAQLLAAGPDLDGDGTPDVDPTRLSYVGVSLGAVMGTQLLALTDLFEAAALVMPGGRMTALLSDPEGSFSDIRRVLLPAALTPGDVDRLFAIMQTALERGDPASWAPSLMRTRPPEAGRAPSLLVQMALDDDIVTNGTTYTLSRAMQIEVVPPELRGGHGLAQTGPAPLSGNLAEGARTVGLLQFDVVEDPAGGPPIAATHSNLSASEVSHASLYHFLRTHWEGGLAEIIDPYEATGLAHAGE